MSKMDVPYIIVYRYFLLFEDLPIADRLRKSAFSNTYYGQGLCEFLNAKTGTLYNYTEIVMDDLSPWTKFMLDLP